MTEELSPETVDGQATAPEAVQGQAEKTSVWYDTAPDEMKGYIQNKAWDDPIKVVEAYQNLEKLRGVPEDRLLKLPKDGEPMDAIWNKLGRPETPDKYEIKLPEDVGQLDENRVRAMKEVAHKLGITQKQLQGLAEIDAQYMTKAVQEYNTQLQQKQEIEYNNLVKEWGSNASEREELARRFVRSNMPDGLDKEETLTKIENAIGTANMLKLFANAGDKFKEDRLPNSEGDRPFGYTREQAIADKKSLMGELKADKKRLDAYNRGVGADYEKMRKYQQIIAG